MVRFERFGGASGVVGVAAIAAQYLLVGVATPDRAALLHDRTRWELTTLLRMTGGLGIVWFTAGLAARLRRPDSRPLGPPSIVLGAGLLWGWAWLLSALFGSAAIGFAASTVDGPAAHVLSVLGVESVLVLTPALAVAFLAATGVAVLEAPSFPRRYGYMALGSAGARLGMGIVDWYGAAQLAMRIMDFTLLWVVVTAVHLLGATRPAPDTGTRTRRSDGMKRQPNLWDRLAAGAGIAAVIWLAAGYAIVSTTMADPAAADAEYVRALMSERMRWELVTLVRLVGGILMLLFMGSLAGRLREAEGEPGRLATAAFGLGVVWAGVWLLSALFNSAAILFAASYDDPAGARIAGVLAQQTPFVLTTSIVFTLLLATAFVALRFGGFPRIYAFGTAAAAVALLIAGVVDWYGPGNVGAIIVGVALTWTAVTSAMLCSRARSGPLSEAL